eukprot:g8425.t1
MSVEETGNFSGHKVREFGVTEAKELEMKSRQTTWNGRETHSNIPKAPLEGARLFRDNDGLDRLYSNIPYPPYSGKLRPALEKLYQRKTQSFGGYSDHGSLPYDTRSLSGVCFRDRINERAESVHLCSEASVYGVATAVLESDAFQGVRSSSNKVRNDVFVQTASQRFDTDDECSFHWSELESTSSWKHTASEKCESLSSTVLVGESECDMECDWQSTISEESLADSVLSYDSLNAFTELEERSTSPATLKPLRPTFLMECRASLGGGGGLAEMRKKQRGVSGSPNFCPKSFHLLAEETGVLPRRPKGPLLNHQGTLLQVASVMESSSINNKSCSKSSTVQKSCEDASSDEQNYVMNFHTELDWIGSKPKANRFPAAATTTAATAAFMDWDLDLLGSRNSSEERFSKMSIGSSWRNENQEKQQRRGVNRWMHGALGVSMKLLVMISGIVMLVQNAKKGKLNEYHASCDLSIFEFPELSITPFFNSGAFPGSILESDEYKPR